ncbi:MAG: dihydrolipoamide dehydrogenase, partial [Spartobacteria bacterium]|nr:dihydrolipoamide dehydrogenase [Spartobacteria bacterium]
EEGLFTVTLRHMESGEEKRITAEALLVATGITPETDRLGLEHTEVRRDEKGFICVDNHLRTDADGVYALGDCVGNYLFRHSVNVEGEYLVRAALDGQAGPLAYPPMPHAVFTLPEVACVGETEEKLQARNATYVRGIATFADCNMGLARRLDHGIVKLLIDRHTRKILGVHIIGEEASSLLHTPLAFMTMGATLDDMLSMVYIHPALPEILREAAREAAAALPTT